MSKEYSGRCSAALQSLTVAQKAQNVLAGAAIPSNIIKTEGSAKSRGCSYGLEFSCGQRGNVEKVLANAGISVKQWNRAD